MENPGFDAVNEIMWAGFLDFAIGEEHIRRECEEATKAAQISAPRNAFEAMIDKATSYDQESTIKPLTYSFGCKPSYLRKVL